MCAKTIRFVGATFLIAVGLVAAALLGLLGSTDQTRAASGDDPTAVIDAYVAAVNAGDLDGILALYADDAIHIALPTADGSAGICRGKADFSKWYTQSVADGDRIAIEDGTFAVDGDRVTFVARLSSEPWRELGIETLQANAEAVVVDGRIMTHVVMLTPESVRELLTARGAI